jgi:hypothetical protein
MLQTVSSNNNPSILVSAIFFNDHGTMHRLMMSVPIRQSNLPNQGISLLLLVTTNTQVMTFDGWVDHLLREMLAANTDDWFRVCAMSARPAQTQRCVRNSVRCNSGLGRRLPVDTLG